MHLKHFTTRLAPDLVQGDQDTINQFMDAVTVKKTATQFVPGNPDYWSILVFYENGQSGKTEKTSEKQPARTEAELDETGQQLLSALKIWRKEKAAEAGLPEFMICHNATLMEVAFLRPPNLAALSQIKGLGEQKIARYGDDMIAIINAF